MKCEHCHAPIDERAVFCPRCGQRVAGAEECTDYRYEAFISYRHLPLDAQVAKSVQKRIEGFRLPKGLAGGRGGERLGKLFRDEDELPSSSSLSDLIEDAILHARFLVVVCTPDTPASRWVTREVELFSQLHGRDHVLLVLAAGEPEESFPPALLSRACESDGAMQGQTGEVPVEPLAADFRSKDRHARETLRLVAAMAGCGYDDLRQRQRIRRNAFAARVGAAVAAVSLAFAGFSAYQQAQISENYRQMQINESEFLAHEANQLAEQGDRYQAIQVALAALPSSSASGDRPFVPAAQLALENALQVFPSVGDWLGCYSEGDVDAWNSCYSAEEGLMATVSAGRFIEVKDLETGSLVSRFDVADLAEVKFSSNDSADLAFAGSKLLFLSHGVLSCFDVRGGELVWSYELKGLMYDTTAFALSPDGKRVAVSGCDSADGDDVLAIIEAQSGTLINTLPLPEAYGTSSYLCYSSDGSKVFWARGNVVACVEIASGKLKQETLRNDDACSLSRVGNCVAVVSNEYNFDVSGKPSLEVFDEELEFLWEHSEEVPSRWYADFEEYNLVVSAVDEWDYASGNVPGAGKSAQLVVAFGTDLLLLDASDGSEVYRKSFDAPLLGCAVGTRSSGGHSIIAYTGDGYIVYSNPTMGKNSDYTDTFLGRNVGVIYKGDFIDCNGRWFFSAWQPNPVKHVVYRHESIEDHEGARLDEALKLESFWLDEKRMAVCDDDDLRVFDTASLDLLSSLSLGSLDRIDASRGVEVELGDSGQVYIAGAAKAAEGQYLRDGTVVYVADESTGAIAQRIDLDDDVTALYPAMSSFGMEEIADDASGLRSLALWAFGAAAVVDLDSGQVKLNIVPESDEWAEEFQEHSSADCPLVVLPGKASIEALWAVGDKLFILREHDADETAAANLSMSIVDWKTAELVSGWQMCDYKGRASSSYDLSEDEDRFVMTCDDGLTRMFDTSSGKLVWESAGISSKAQCMHIVSSGNLFYQDPSGECVLVSGKTGEQLATSSTVLPQLMDAAMYSPEPNTLSVWRAGSAYKNVFGLAVISLDEDAFGPVSYVNNGLLRSTDGSCAVVEIAYSDNYVVRAYSLDELIEKARETVQGHELTAAERHLYHLDPR